MCALVFATDARLGHKSYELTANKPVIHAIGSFVNHKIYWHIVSGDRRHRHRINRNGDVASLYAIAHYDYNMCSSLELAKRRISNWRIFLFLGTSHGC